MSGSNGRVTSSELNLLLWAAVGQACRRFTHEANNMLAAVVGHAELGRISPDPARALRSLEVVESGGRDLQELVAGLAELALGASRRHSAPENVADCVRAVLPLVARAVEKAEAHLETRFDAVPPVYCDRGAVALTLFSLMLGRIDAVKAAGGGKIGVSVLEGDGGVVLELTSSAPEESAAENGGEGSDSAGTDGEAGLGARLARAVALYHAGEFSTGPPRGAEGAGESRGVWRVLLTAAPRDEDRENDKRQAVAGQAAAGTGE